MDVKVLGSGCKKCNALEKSTAEALAELGISAEVKHINDFSEIASYGVMTTPALVIDEEVVSLGKALKKSEIVEIIKNLK
ncbi:MAG: thioredoxin family protein [Tissierellia bacterium]|nr:thioredoxin family protein [Tissierellia bacterium]